MRSGKRGRKKHPPEFPVDTRDRSLAANCIAKTEYETESNQESSADAGSMILSMNF
jgi:hypothetical protein